MRVVAAGMRIGLLRAAPVRYHRVMGHNENVPSPVPAEWLEAMDESDAQLAARQTALLEPLLDELRRSAEQLEAKLADRPERASASRSS